MLLVNSLMNIIKLGSLLVVKTFSLTRERTIGMSNLYRSSDEKVIAGVCAGVAHKLDLNVTGLRWVVALTTLFLSGVPALVYLVLWVVLKERSITVDVVDIE